MPRGIGRTACCLLFSGACAWGQTSPAANATVRLSVPAGTPLRLYVTKRFPKRQGQAVTAKVIEPVYAFDREVIPAGAVVTGMVALTQPVKKWERARAMMRGDFTPLKISLVEFGSLRLPDGRAMPLSTAATAGLNTIYFEHRKKQPKQPPAADPNAGTRQKLEGRIKEQVNGRVERVTDMVHAPGKMERLGDFAMSKLPYHPQQVARGTRFDAELSRPLSFGAEPVPAEASAALGGDPPPDSVIAARLLTPLDSGSAKQGDAVEAVLTEPVFAAGHKLVLPEGTRLEGAVLVTRRARWFHRGGRLRFTFSKVELPTEAAALRPASPVEQHRQVVLAAAEAGGGELVKTDSEGGVKASEPKTRFIAPLLSWIVASRSADLDAGMPSKLGTGAVNQGGRGLVEKRTLGGGLGLGLVGMAISQASPYVGMAMGYYGLAWSVFSNLISRGAEVHFEKNAVLEIKFAGRPGPPGATLGAKQMLPSGADRALR